jgi:insulysin
MTLSPKVYESPATCCLTSLFISLLCDALNEYAYDAELAGISYKICGTVYSLDVNNMY